MSRHPSHERGLESQTQKLQDRLAFVVRVLRIFWTEDMPDMLFWRVDDNQPSFYVLCSDTFAWATADVEQITPDNVELLERTIAEVRAVSAGDAGMAMWAFYLFCARVRGVRIMPKIIVPAVLREMFDACGPEMIPVTNAFLHESGRRILEEFGSDREAD